MEKFLNRLERKLGRYAIHRLTAVLIGCYVIGYVISVFSPSLLSYMYLDPAYILKGQIWRLITWIIVPPSSAVSYNLIFAVIMLFFYFSIGTALERTWGDFRYNVYIFGGLIISIIAAFISYFVLRAATGSEVYIGGVFSTYYICMSILLAFAFTFPDIRVMLWFVIPLKVKWLGIVYGLFMAYDIVTYLRAYFSTRNGAYIVGCVAIVASLANFLIFFMGQNHKAFAGKRRAAQYRTYQRRNTPGGRTGGTNGREYGGTNGGEYGNAGGVIFAAGKSSGSIARHRCIICGRTDVTDPDLDFRYCSKCVPGSEYCSDHLFTHIHNKKEN